MIRAECVRALGLWFKKYPGHFLDSSYLRYVGWVLSDASTQVRLEAVKALSGVYEQVDYIGSLNLFTERFKPRMIEMASGDTELGVRVAVIQVLRAIDRHSLLEDEEREKLCLLVFDEEPRVRKAVGGFVKGVWEDSVEERMIAKRAGGKGQDDEKESERAGAKALAALLVKWGKALDEATDDGDEDSDEQGRPDGGARESNRRFKEVAATVASGQKGRTALAVEALWAQVDPVSDWAGLLDFLLLDHSAPGEDQAQGRSKAARRRPATAGQSGTERQGDDAVDEAWRLVEEEESVLLEVLVASLRRAKADHASSKKVGIPSISVTLKESSPDAVFREQMNRRFLISLGLS
jgi:cohesin complex subunit SA-1/2